MKLVDILARELKEWPNDQYESIGQANDGALHKSPNWDTGCGWSKEKYTMAEDWSRVHVTRAQWQAAVDALKAEKVIEWNGEGLPPVGTVCEMTFDDGDYRWGYWLKTKVLCYGDTMAFVSQETERKPGEWLEGSIKIPGMKFRPIRTPEQIAAEERNNAIAAMMQKVVTATPHDCALLYDAGYRKFEIVDN